jgi:hypothetical protein
MTRNKIWPAVADVKLERFREKLYDTLCRHLVCLGVRFTRLDSQGNSDGMEYLCPCSCFVISVRDRWFLVTAGHVLKELDQAVRQKKIRVESSFLADFFGKRSAVRYPTPFPYEDMPKHYIDDDGLDLGFIPLRDLFKEGMRKNIIPISEKHWCRRHDLEIAAYWMLGFPGEVHGWFNKPINAGEDRISVAAPVIISAEEIRDIAEIPTSVVIPSTTFPRFIGRINLEIPFDIKGMSGGPIFGLIETADGKVGYTVIALQSSWYEDSRIILGCPIHVFGKIIDRHEAGMFKGI